MSIGSVSDWTQERVALDPCLPSWWQSPIVKSQHSRMEETQRMADRKGPHVLYTATSRKFDNLVQGGLS